MYIGLSERWILLADVSNSTHFFWELMEAGRQKPEALFESSSIYAGQMESIFGIMANVCSDRLVAHLGNTMGDGFILVGRHGHGADHIRTDAPRVLELARMVKAKSEDILAAAKDRIEAHLRASAVPRGLPDLKMKVTLHHGYVVTMMQSQRFFGDTVNYCARIASAAFDNWHEGIVLTEGFVGVLPEPLQSQMESLKVAVEIRYPARERAAADAYRIAMNAQSGRKLRSLQVQRPNLAISRPTSAAADRPGVRRGREQSGSSTEGVWRFSITKAVPTILTPETSSSRRSLPPFPTFRA